MKLHKDKLLIAEDEDSFVVVRILDDEPCGPPGDVSYYTAEVLHGNCEALNALSPGYQLTRPKLMLTDTDITEYFRELTDTEKLLYVPKNR